MRMPVLAGFSLPLFGCLARSSKWTLELGTIKTGVFQGVSKPPRIGVRDGKILVQQNGPGYAVMTCCNARNYRQDDLGGVKRVWLSCDGFRLVCNREMSHCYRCGIRPIVSQGALSARCRSYRE
jgi:hypothetical protein